MTTNWTCRTSQTHSGKETTISRHIQTHACKQGGFARESGWGAKRINGKRQMSKVILNSIFKYDTIYNFCVMRCKPDGWKRVCESARKKLRMCDAKKKNGKNSNKQMERMREWNSDESECKWKEWARETEMLKFFLCSSFEKLGSCYCHCCCCCWAVLLCECRVYIMHLFVPRMVSKTSKKRFICAFMLLNYIFPRRFAYFALLFFAVRRRRHRRPCFSLVMPLLLVGIIVAVCW